MWLSIIKYSIGSLCWGFLIATVLMALFIVLIKGWYKNATFKPYTWIITVALGLILFFNCTLISGAFAIKKATADVEEILNTYVIETYYNLNIPLTEEETNQAFQQVVEQHPILFNYADWANFEGYTPVELPVVMCDTLKTYLNNYIVKKVLWSLGFTLLGAILVILNLEKQNKSRRTSTPKRQNTSRPRPLSRRPMRRSSF